MPLTKTNELLARIAVALENDTPKKEELLLGTVFNTADFHINRIFNEDKAEDLNRALQKCLGSLHKDYGDLKTASDLSCKFTKSGLQSYFYTLLNDDDSMEYYPEFTLEEIAEILVSWLFNANLWVVED